MSSEPLPKSGRNKELRTASLGHHTPLNHDGLQTLQSTTSGPIAGLNPTHKHFQHVDKDSSGVNIGQEIASPQNQRAADQIQFRWTSRNNRKGRHQLDVKSASSNDAKYLVPHSTSSIREVLKTIGRMFTKYPFWDVSWIVAYIFTIGSVVWVFNAFFVWLPLQKPSTEFGTETLYGGGITAFVGATIFEIGSVFLMLEAINENRTDCFGWAVEEVIEGDETNKRRLQVKADATHCRHHHQNRKNLVGKSLVADHKEVLGDSKGGGGGYDGGATDQNGNTGSQRKSWSWWPSWHDLATHYIYELGFIACSFQMVGATIFWIAGFTALPGILNRLSPGLEDGVYWTPQVVGGSGFIVSGFLFMLETQKRWYLPAFDALGWHIGFWNFIGGVGFTLSPCFGYDPASWSQYQAALSTFWASWAFMIGSSIQLYESLQKNPVDVVKSTDDSAA